MTKKDKKDKKYEKMEAKVPKIDIFLRKKIQN